MKRITCALLALLLLAALSGCGESSAPSGSVSSSATFVPDNLGNLPGNIILGGHYAQCGTDVYTNRDNYIARVTSDSGSISVFPDAGTYLNAVGSRIYYGGTGLYSIKTDGTDKKEIRPPNDYYFFDIYVADDWIYFIEGRPSPLDSVPQAGQIFRVKTDGSQYTILCNDTVTEMLVADGWIYYAPLNGNQIYKMKADGSEKTAIAGTNDCVGYTPDFNVYGGYLYYHDGNGHIKRASLDGSENSAIINNAVSASNSFVVYNGHIYYISTDKKIYRTDLKGASPAAAKNAAGAALLGITSKNLYFDSGQVELDSFGK